MLGPACWTSVEGRWETGSHTCSAPIHTASVADCCGRCSLTPSHRHVCCQGGDLKKYASAGIGYYVSADHALGSVRDAVDRYNNAHCDFPGHFIAADCHRVLLSRSYHPHCWFDLVSCQFALHYSFESHDTASHFIWNVAERLLPGGHFIATLPDSERLMSHSGRTHRVRRKATAGLIAVPLTDAMLVSHCSPLCVSVIGCDTLKDCRLAIASCK